MTKRSRKRIRREKIKREKKEKEQKWREYEEERTWSRRKRKKRRGSLRNLYYPIILSFFSSPRTGFRNLLNG